MMGNTMNNLKETIRISFGRRNNINSKIISQDLSIIIGVEVDPNPRTDSIIKRIDKAQNKMIEIEDSSTDQTQGVNIK